MRAFNSVRILIPIVFLIVRVSSRSISDDAGVIDKKLEEQKDQIIADIGGKLDSGGSEEGIRRFDAVVEDTEKDQQDQGSNDEDKVVEVESDDVAHQKRSIEGKLDAVEGQAILDPKHEVQGEIGNSETKESRERNEGIQIRQIPELIPVKIDHAGPYEPHFGGTETARKSLDVVEDEKIDDDEEDDIRSERSSEKKEAEKESESIVQKWKLQALTIQNQLKNRTFFKYLKEQVSEVLPDIPKFTENQLLEALKTIASTKSLGSEESHIKNLNTSMLNDKQLEVIKCAEGLVAEKQRQSFAENFFECMRGLNILNCMRIYIWPIIAENVPERIVQNFPALPIEVSLSDFIPNRQGDEPKNIRGVHQQRLLMPETVVANILKDALAVDPHDENIPTQIDPENFAKLLTPGQLDILKMAEKFLPESVRQEYSSKMHSCVRRFEYFSCVKYFTWPMVKQYYTALPDFPDYQTWYPSTISVYPGYPIIPFPDLSDNNGQLPEVIEADGFIHRTPRPETIIFQLLRNTVEEQPRHQAAAEIYALPDTSSITPEQLASLQMAQQLVPVAYREEFVDKTVKCIQEHNYLFCTKYSTWPTLKQFQPRLPAFADLESVFGNLFSKIPNFGSFFSGDSNNKKNLTGFFSQLPWAGSWTGGSGLQGGSGSGGGSSQGTGTPWGTGGGSTGSGGFPQYPGGSGGGQLPGFPGIGGHIPNFPGGGAQIPSLPGIGGTGGNIPGVGGSGGGIPNFPGIGSGSGGSNVPNHSGGTITWSGIPGIKPPGTISWGGINGGQGSGSPGGSIGSGQTGGGNLGHPWGPGQGSGSPGIGSSGGSSNGGYVPSGPSIGGQPWGPGQGSGSAGSSGSSGSSNIGSGQTGGSGISIPAIGNHPWGSGQGSGTPGSSGSSGSGQVDGGGSSIPSVGGQPWGPGQGSSSPGSSSPSGPSNSGSGQTGGGGISIPSIGGLPWGGGQGSGGSGGSGSTGPSIPSVGGQPWGGGQGSGTSGSGSSSGPSNSGSGQTGGGWGGGQASGSSGGSGSSGSSNSGYGPNAGGGSSSGSSSSSGPSNSGQSGGTGSSNPSIGGIPWTGGQGSSSSPGQSGQSGGSITPIPGGGTVSWTGGNGGYIPAVVGGISSALPGITSLGEQGSGSSASSGSSGSSISSGGSSSPSGDDSSGSGSGNLGGTSGSGGGSYRPKIHKEIQADDAMSEQLSKGPAETLQQKSLEAKIIDILYNLRYTILESPVIPIPMVGPRAVLRQLNEDQIIILSLAKSIIPPPMRADFASQTVGCLQGGSNFLGCTKNVIWPFLTFYVPNIPAFPDEKPQVMEKHSPELDFIPGREYSLEPVSYAPFIGQHHLAQLFRQPFPILGRSPLRSEISAKADDQPIISVTDPKFVPIYTDHPDTVILKILSAMADSVEKSSPADYRSRVPAFMTFYSTINSSLNEEQERILKTTEYLIPESSRQVFFNEILVCLIDNSFQTCARDNIWPTLTKHYPRIPSFPNFQENSVQDNQSPSPDYRHISETDVKTGQHGDTVVTITDTRFVPIFGEHPEEIILTMLKGIQPSSLNQINTTPSSIAKSPPYASIFTKSQGDIVVVAENLLPESIRDIFVIRMSECVRDTNFLDCARDIAWPTIGQFFPRLASFPNFGSLPSLTDGKPQQPTLLPPVLDSEFPRINQPDHNQLQQLPETLESKLESLLAKISGLRGNIHSGVSYLNTEDPLTAALVTDKQVKIIRMTEGLIPEDARPMFIVKIMGCVRGSGFPICSQAVAWPTLRQFLPNIPEFPDISNFLPEVPEIPNFSTLQEHLPEIPNFSQFGQGLGQLIPQFQQPTKSTAEFTTGQHSVLLPGYTASVGSAPVVPPFPGQPTDILIDISQDRVIFPDTEREPLDRKRREIINLLEDEQTSKTDDASTLNITEADLLQLLSNATTSTEESLEPTRESLLESLNSTIKASLTPQQLAILKLVEKLGIKNTRGVMGQVIRCVTGLSFIRCMGIFMWPLITSTVPSLLGIQLPFGRSAQDTDGLSDVSVEDLEKELFVRKEEMEHTLLDWYKSLTEEKFESTLGLIKFEGYGNGEIGIKFSEARTGRAKIKDHKNLPSILTIISDIMEDVLNTGRGSHKLSKDKRKGKGRSLPFDSDPEELKNSENIVNLFLQRLKANKTDGISHLGNHRFNPSDAYQAFELLFGPRLKARLANNLEQLQENKIELNYDNYNTEGQPAESTSPQRLRVIPLQLQEEKSNLFDEIQHEQDTIDDNKFSNEEITKSPVVIHLPKLDDEIISRKMSDSLTSLARHMNKNNMIRIIPGIGFAVTFILQMALAHARAAASMATMLSNMAMGTAMFSLVRQAMFGQTTHPKIKYVYDTDVHGPGISWPA